MIILMIELGIWVILACPNFIRSGHTFEGKWLLKINDSGGVLVFEGKWVTIEGEHNGLLWSVHNGLLWCVYAGLLW